MTPDELKAKLEELRAAIVEKVTELEEEPNWGTSEEREELLVAVDELIVQAQALSDLLQEGA